MQTVDEALDKLQRSAFRRKFHLSPKDREYVREKGMDVIRSHGEEFIAKRLAPAAVGAALKNGTVFPRDVSFPPMNSAGL